jgi:hypothetical protein
VGAAEDAHAAGEVWHRRLPLVLQRLQEAPDLSALCDAPAPEVRRSPASTA